MTPIAKSRNPEEGGKIVPDKPDRGEAEVVPTNARLRLVNLDLLRLLAIFLVLGRHMDECPGRWPSVPKAILDGWRRGGWVGVDLFFVLSGFLISGLLFSEFKTRGQFSLGRFYMRRGWKIYPPFAALFAATVALNAAFARPMRGSQICSESLFLQSYVPGLWRHTWSLSVEEHFYFALPLLLLGLGKLRPGSCNPYGLFPAIAVGVAIWGICARVATHLRLDRFSMMTHLCPTHLRIDSLLWGVLIGYLYQFHNEAFCRTLRPWRRSLLGLGAILLAPAFLVPLDHPVIYTIGFTTFFLGSGFILMGAVLSDAPTGGVALALASLGAFSYSIYLWHMPMMNWGLPVIDESLNATLSFEVRNALYFTGSIGLGVVMAKLIELPALRLRDRWFPSRVRSAEPRQRVGDASVE